MAADKKVFDDPQYASASMDSSEYDSPSRYLDLVESPAEVRRNREDGESSPASPLVQDTRVQQLTADGRPSDQQASSSAAVEDSGDYATVDDFFDAGNEDQERGSFSEHDSEDEEGREGGRVSENNKRFSHVRQSRSNRETFEETTKIYVQGELAPLRPMLSFKSRITRGQSREELEYEGIYQGLRITDEQRQQIGIMPESIYMTVALERSTAVLENMSMELEQLPSPSTRPPPVEPRSGRRSSVTPAYRGLVLFPPPLPPLSPGAPTSQRKCHAVMENIVKSEAAFLTSLKIAEEVYMGSLLGMSSPPIDKEQVRVLFGPIKELLAHHELFYTALTQRTNKWSPKQTVGNVFMTFYRREVITDYVAYVNNFTDAMATLQRNIKKHNKFVTYLKAKYSESKTSLSLQGLLLKPVQRFPQYILFLKDLIKYTAPHHPDRVTLQLALARCETIAEHLDDARRTKEQLTIVAHLSTRISQLPFKLQDSPNRILLLQELVTSLILSPQGSENLVQHKRSLLLFNNMVMCAAMNKVNKKGQSDVVGGGGDEIRYKCKWQAPLDKVTVVEPDFTNDIWDHRLALNGSEASEEYVKIKREYMKYTQDFETIGKIASLVYSLEDSYIGLKVSSVQGHLRVLQRKIASAKEKLKKNQTGRLDLQIPSRDGSHLVHHTYIFESESAIKSESAKQNFLNNLRYATLKLKDENKMAWVCAENTEEDDIIIDSVGHLPLFVESYRLTNNKEALSTECATKTSDNQVWFASCSNNTAEIAIIQSVIPKPILRKSFTVDSSRILAICYVPRESSSNEGSPPQSSMLSVVGPPPLSPDSDTIWMGSQTGKLMIHPTSIEVAQKCMEIINFTGPITCIKYHMNQVYVAVEGNLYIYKRPEGSAWDLDNPIATRIHEGEGSIMCMCQVGHKLWIGASNHCYIFNTRSNRLEGHFQVSQTPMMAVRNMAAAGSGVWISLRRSPSLQLYHTVTKTLLQEIDIDKAFRNIAARHNLGHKLHGVTNLHITSLLLCNGYLWIGTSTGAIMVYRTPYLKTVPVTTGKPYMAQHSHSSGVRVLVSTETAGTISGSRFDQFVSQEQERFQDEWDQVEPEDGQLQSQVNGESDAGYALEEPIRVEEEGGGGGVEDGSATYPPLPPPSFEDLSPHPTLKSVENEGNSSEGDGTSSGEQSRAATLKSPSATETGNTPTIASIEFPDTTTGEAAPDSSQPRQDDGLAMPVRRNSSKKREGEKVGRGGGGEEGAGNSPGDAGTFRRLNTLEASSKGPPLADEEASNTASPPPLEVTPPPLYDDVSPDHSSLPRNKRSPSPYEDPSTLHLTGPVPLHPMPDFITTLKQSVIPALGNGTMEGAAYVLTGGRGFTSLQPGRKRSLQYIKPGDESAADESCVIAYELKH